MTDQELKQYIRDRLSGKGFDPPFSRSRDQEPEYFLVSAYKNSETNSFKRNFKNSITSLINEIEPQRKNGEDLSRLLYLIEELEIKEARSRLEYLWDQREKFRGWKTRYPSLDLLVQLIGVYSKFQMSDTKKKKKLVSELDPYLDDEKYAPVAFNAILEAGIKQAMERLIKFYRTAKKADKPIWIKRALDFIAEIYGKGDDSKGANLACKQWEKLKRESEDRESIENIEGIMKDIPEYKQCLLRERNKINEERSFAKSPAPYGWQKEYEGAHENRHVL